MSNEGVDVGRRRFLTLTTSVVGGAGVVAWATPFLASMAPSERAKALGAPTEIDISKIEPGAMIKIQWRGKPVLVVRRTEEMIKSLGGHDNQLRDPGSASSKQPDYAKNQTRAIKPEFLVLVGVCTHLGCLPQNRSAGAHPDVGLKGDWPGGFFCPCHGSKFDLAGRVFAGVPAPINLEVPPYSYADENHIVIGLDPAKEA